MITLITNFIKALKSTLINNRKNRWTHVENETHKWDERNKVIASYIQKESSVLDIGAGSQSLRKYLDDTVQYTPCDVISRPGTLHCDINKNVFPEISTPYDYVVCSGVIEYIYFPRKAIRQLTKLGKKMLLSYTPIKKEKSLFARIHSGWKNHLTQNQFENILHSCSRSVRVNDYRRDQIIYELDMNN